MESVSSIGSQIAQSSIVIPVDCDFIVVVWVHGVGRNSLDPDSVCGIVRTLGLILSVEVLLSRRVLLDKADIGV